MIDPDFSATSDGSIVLLLPLTEEGRLWCEFHLPEDCPMMGRAFAIEVKYFPDILAGIRENGLEAVNGN